MRVPQRLRHQQHNAEHELAFREVLGRALMRRMRDSNASRAVPD